MRQRYLRVSYTRGKPFAAYLYLPRHANDRSARTDRREAGMLVDYAADGRPIGVEITAPGIVSLNAINEILKELNQQPATADEIAPLFTSPKDLHATA